MRDVQETAKYLGKMPAPVHLEMFTATKADDPQSCRPVEDLQSWPTYDNVKSSIKKVTSLAKSGDFVYIHYSGHGTPIEPSAENKHLGDVALNLLEGENGDMIHYLRGVELAYLINNMVTKGLLVTLVLDCCFAGGVSRHEEPESIRSLSYNAKIDAAYPPDRMESLSPEASESSSRDGSMLPNWLINPDKYTILAACGPHEVAREIEFEDKRRHGALSYLLLRTLTKIDTSVRTQLDIYSHLHITFRQIYPRQNPVLYGNKDLRFFGSLMPKENNLSIPVVKGKASSLCLQGGQAHGLCNGDLFAIYPFYSTESESGKPREGPITARVTNTRALTSDLELVNQSQGQNRVRTGWVARPLTRVSLRQYPIQLSAALPDPEQWLEASKERTSLVIHRADALNQPFSYQITLDDSGVYQIRDESYRKIPNLPVVPGAHEEAVADILDIVEHLSWFKHVKAIFNPQPADAFLQSFSIKFTDRSGKMFDGEQVIKVNHNDIIVLEVQNKGKTPLYLYVYNLGHGWEIEDLFYGAYDTIPARDSTLGFPGLTRKKLKMTVPSDMLAKGYEECEDVIKIFVTTQPTTFMALEMPNINTLTKMDANGVSTPIADSSSGGGESLDDWIALNFHVHTTIKKS